MQNTTLPSPLNEKTADEAEVEAACHCVASKFRKRPICVGHNGDDELWVVGWDLGDGQGIQPLYGLLLVGYFI